MCGQSSSRLASATAQYDLRATLSANNSMKPYIVQTSEQRCSQIRLRILMLIWSYAVRIYPEIHYRMMRNIIELI